MMLIWTTHHPTNKKKGTCNKIARDKNITLDERLDSSEGEKMVAKKYK